MERISVGQRRARLAHRHRLVPGVQDGGPVDAARSVVVLHSTDPVTVFLSVRARTREVGVSELERALYDERELVRMMGMRRTLFVVPRDLAAVIEAACSRKIAAAEGRRLEKIVAASDVPGEPARWLADTSRDALAALAARGEAFAADLAASVPELARPLRVGSGTRYEVTQSAASRVLPQLAAQGLVVRGRPRGTWVGGQYRWVPWSAWLGGELERFEPAAARAMLLRRWLAAFGPATETDLRWWTGWTAGETRAALAAVQHVVVELDGATGYVLADDLDAVEPPEPAAALLPSLDPTTMGWKERDWYLGSHGAALFDRNGNAGPTLWWDGRIVGGWSQLRGGEVVFRLLEDVGGDAVAAIEREAERLAAWLGEVRFSPRYPTPLQRELSA